MNAPAGLKSHLAALGRVLGETPIALYERQKALVAEGLLDQTPGRGPGSGVRATPQSVAMLVVALMASPGTAGGTDRTRKVANAAGRCNLTGAARFVDAVASVLGDAALAARVDGIAVGDLFVSIAYDEGQLSVFNGPPRARALSVQINIAGHYVRQLAALVQNFSTTEK